MEYYLVTALCTGAFVFVAGIVLYLLSCSVLYGGRKLPAAVDVTFGYGEQVGAFGMLTGSVMMLVLLPIVLVMTIVQAL